MQTEPAAQATNLIGIPHLVVTGEASFHQPYEYCTVKYMQQVGIKVDWMDLGKMGVKGNGHMIFMEKNNIELADLVYGWMGKH